MSSKIEHYISTENLPMDIKYNKTYRIEQANPNSYTHSYFKYPCKFIPEIPRWAINKYMTSKEGIIFDPFAGSGTTLLEGIIHGYKSYGTEIDSIAKLIIKVKTTSFTGEELELLNMEYQKVIDIIDVDIDENDLPKINNLSHWFSNESATVLAKLKKNMGKIENQKVKDFLRVVFASIIKKTSFADDSSPKPYVSSKIIKTPPEPLQEFIKTYENYYGKLVEFSNLKVKAEAKLVAGDALNFNLDKKADLAITSPPYINAFDYGRTMRLENIWLDELTEEELREKKKDYVGTESINVKVEGKALDILDESELLADYYDQIYAVDSRRALIVKKFFEDMKVNLKMVYANLNDDGHYVIVIGNSNIRKVEIESWKVLKAIALNMGYKVENYFNYLIQNPYINIPRKGKGGKINIDHVLILKKGE